MTDPSARRLHIHACLGRGGFGEVYRATMTSVGGVRHEVAVKVLRPDVDPSGDAVRRLRDEGRLLGLLSHPAILRVHDLVLLDGRVALVTEYVEGQDLDQCARGPDRIPLRALLNVVGEVAAALDVAWATPTPDGAPMGLVHRDVKPANIRVGKHGEVKLLDFGIARATSLEPDARSAEGALVGSTLYMAPERFHDEAVAPPSDVYSLGCVLFEGLAGQGLFEGLSLKQVYGIMLLSRKLQAHVDERSTALPADAPGPVRELLTSLLDPKPGARPTARELARRCEDLADGVSGPTLKRWARERTWPAPVPIAGALDGRELTAVSFDGALAAFPPADPVVAGPVLSPDPPTGPLDAPPTEIITLRPRNAEPPVRPEPSPAPPPVRAEPPSAPAPVAEPAALALEPPAAPEPVPPLPPVPAPQPSASIPVPVANPMGETVAELLPEVDATPPPPPARPAPVATVPPQSDPTEEATLLVRASPLLGSDPTPGPQRASDGPPLSDPPVRPASQGTVSLGLPSADSVTDPALDPAPLRPEPLPVPEPPPPPEPSVELQGEGARRGPTPVRALPTPPRPSIGGPRQVGPTLRVEPVTAEPPPVLVDAPTPIPGVFEEAYASSFDGALVLAERQRRAARRAQVQRVRTLALGLAVFIVFGASIAFVASRALRPKTEPTGLVPTASGPTLDADRMLSPPGDLTLEPTAPSGPESTRKRNYRARLASPEDPAWALARSDPRAAVEAFDRILERSPKSADAHYGRGVALLGLARKGEAVESLCTAIRLGDPYVGAEVRGLLQEHGLRCP